MVKKNEIRVVCGMTEAMLIDKKTGRVTVVNKPVFRIGREKGYVDYLVEEPTVSRVHCVICTKNDAYAITDSNSTNHTYVDGVCLPANVEQPLRHGAVIGLGELQLVFYLREGKVE